MVKELFLSSKTRSVFYKFLLKEAVKEKIIFPGLESLSLSKKSSGHWEQDKIQEVV